MTKQNKNHKNKPNSLPFPGWLVGPARRAGIYILIRRGCVVDFVDLKTGKSLGIWKQRPSPHHYVIDDRSYPGTTDDALNAILRKRFVDGSET